VSPRTAPRSLSLPPSRLVTPLAALALAGGLALAPPAAPAAPLTVQVQARDGSPLPGAVVFVESAAAKAAVKPRAVEIGQEARRFAPAVTVVPVGSEVSFPNRDTVRHHVYSFSPAKTFELKLYIGTPAKPVVFDQPGIAVLGCNIHDQMVAWVVIVETPWHAQTGNAGVATLDVPAGAHRLRAWHRDLPPGEAALEQAIQVAASGGAVTVRLVGVASAAAVASR
jgi:plastocyanin